MFADALGAGDQFALVFAICASFIAVASLLNARLVMRLGMRKLSHAALLAYIAIAAVHLSSPSPATRAWSSSPPSRP